MVSHHEEQFSEPDRISALRKLLILDSPYEAVFDAIALLASQVCGMPIALISLVDSERQWFKAQVGLEGVRETSRELAFCSHTIRENSVMEIKDATKDSRFLDNPLVTGHPNIVFYAGAPIALPLGEKIGSVCVIDTKPNALNDMQKQVLTGLANITTKALLARRISLQELNKLTVHNMDEPI
ncbi:MAG: GAF domain-containing protein [Methylophilus sp.]|uniref:GAF domain-containing protein n=1 Tax=Methylophilus sp. TaxID=29541 RepID=UPI002BC4EA95|nr:GAF domain-containing protein [Methylophilus sp.]HSH87623.1 GAF domain-containing protein [Methylophilus sp.]